MKKQTQTRQYGYVSPKCKFAQVPTGLAFCASPGSVDHDGYNGTEIMNGSEEEGI